MFLLLTITLMGAVLLSDSSVKKDFLESTESFEIQMTEKAMMDDPPKNDSHEEFLSLAVTSEKYVDPGYESFEIPKIEKTMMDACKNDSHEESLAVKSTNYIDDGYKPDEMTQTSSPKKDFGEYMKTWIGSFGFGSSYGNMVSESSSGSDKEKEAKNCCYNNGEIENDIECDEVPSKSVPELQHQEEVSSEYQEDEANYIDEVPSKSFSELLFQEEMSSEYQEDVTSYIDEVPSKTVPELQHQEEVSSEYEEFVNYIDEPYLYEEISSSNQDDVQSSWSNCFGVWDGLVLSKCSQYFGFGDNDEQSSESSIFDFDSLDKAIQFFGFGANDEQGSWNDFFGLGENGIITKSLRFFGLENSEEASSWLDLFGFGESGVITEWLRSFGFGKKEQTFSWSGYIGLGENGILTKVYRGIGLGKSEQTYSCKDYVGLGEDGVLTKGLRNIGLIGEKEEVSLWKRGLDLVIKGACAVTTSFVNYNCKIYKNWNLLVDYMKSLDYGSLYSSVVSYSEMIMNYMMELSGSLYSILLPICKQSMNFVAEICESLYSIALPYCKMSLDYLAELSAFLLDIDYLKMFSSLLSYSIETLEYLKMSSAALVDYIRNMNTDEVLRSYNDVRDYLKEQSDLIVGYLKGVKYITLYSAVFIVLFTMMIYWSCIEPLLDLIVNSEDLDALLGRETNIIADYEQNYSDA